MAKHAIDFWLTTEDLPHPDNRVTVDREGTHPPLQDLPQQEPHRRLLGEAQGRCSASSAAAERVIPRWSVLDQRIPLAGIAHQCGTVRFGDDPASSALDVNCKAHDLDNLYVVDTSFFPSSSAVNPALTAMANALRVGDHLLERLGARRRRADERRRRRAPGGDLVKVMTNLANSIGKGLVAGFAGTAAMTVSSTLEAKLRGRAPSSAPARATAKVLGHQGVRGRRREGALQRPLPLGLRHRRGASCAGCSAPPGMPARGRDRSPRRGHLRRRPGHAPGARDRAAVVFWGKQEVAIDAFHHAVYAAATGIAYELISRPSNGSADPVAGTVAEDSENGPYPAGRSRPRRIRSRTLAAGLCRGTGWSRRSPPPLTRA